MSNLIVDLNYAKIRIVAWDVTNNRLTRVIIVREFYARQQHRRVNNLNKASKSNENYNAYIYIYKKKRYISSVLQSGENRSTRCAQRYFPGSREITRKKKAAHDARRCHNVINSFYTGARKSADCRANMKVSPSLRVLTSKLSHGQNVRGF